MRTSPSLRSRSTAAAEPARPRTATDLALLTASVRAQATVRPGSPVHDPYAQRLTGEPSPTTQPASEPFS